MCGLATTEGSRDDGRTPDEPSASSPIELWRIHGTTADLRGLAISTSFGYALGLELDSELVLLHLQPSLEVLVGYANRIETALLAQGWHRIDHVSSLTQERS